MTDLDAPLRTARLTLRPPAADDVERLWPYVSDPELPRFMSWDAHRDRAETAAFVARTVRARAARTGFVWLVEHEQTLCGLVGLEGVVRTMRAWRQDRAELGYWCAPALQNRGFTTEAARAVLRFAFAEVGLHKVATGCVVDNTASLRVIAKLGFRLVGEQRDHFFRYGRWWHHQTFEMLDAEWAAADGRDGRTSV